ncbi:MAG: PKD domain-containing protein [Chitinophagaceae bacterium]|nr:PKD domain-containing protein [Chitinophagaceae bacterium]
MGDQVLHKVGSWNAYVHLPPDYNSQPTKRYPTIIFICGLGEVGTNPANLLKFGPSHYISKGHNMQFMVDGVLETPIVISLQPASGWPQDWFLNRHLDSVLRRWRVDTTRWYGTGLSMGGWAFNNYISWSENYARRLTAIVPMSSPESGAPIGNYSRFVNAGGRWWGFEGTTDYRKMDLIFNAMNAAVPNSARYTKYVGGHCCWNTWYNPDWRENGVNIYEWMLRQRKAGTTPNTAPVANAGANQQLTLPVNSTTLAGTATDAQNNISTYQWRKVAGGAATIANTSAATTAVTGLVQGTYLFELTVNDAQGLAGRDTVQVTVLPAPIPNVAPVAVAGPDQVLQFPTSSTVLNGSASADTDGTVAAYSWRALEAQTSIIEAAGQSVTRISSMAAGLHRFELTVTDDDGAKATDTVAVFVNRVPVVVLGPDRVLPVGSSLQLQPTVSDPDGSIVDSTVNVVSADAMVQQRAAAFDFANLPGGKYYIILQVTDDRGAQATDSMYLVVNEYPVADAGNDILLQTAVNSAILTGANSYDPEGGALQYRWIQLPGSPAVTFSNAQAVTTSLSGLQTGTYRFALTVTDEYGFTHTDTVRLSLQPVVRSRVLIDAGPAAPVGQITIRDRWGKYWNNVTDGRPGVRLNRAVDTANQLTTIGVEVISRLDGTFSITGNGMNGGNNIGDVGDYPASAVNDNAFAHSSTTSGKWRIFGLDPNLSYHFKFWGSRSTYGVRTLQVKRSGEASYTQEFNSVLNRNYNLAANFPAISGVTEVVFDMQVKPGQMFGNFSVIDITAEPLAAVTPKQLNPSQGGMLVVRPAQTAPKPAALKLWPNPTKGQVQLQLDGDYSGQVQVIITNIQGAAVRALGLQKLSGQWQAPLSLAGLPAGMYYVQTRLGHQLLTQKLIIQ